MLLGARTALKAPIAENEVNKNLALRASTSTFF